MHIRILNPIRVGVFPDNFKEGNKRKLVTIFPEVYTLVKMVNPSNPSETWFRIADTYIGEEEGFWNKHMNDGNIEKITPEALRFSLLLSS